MQKENKKSTKKISYECKPCGIRYNLPCSLWINEQGKPECTGCGRGLTRRVERVTA